MTVYLLNIVMTFILGYAAMNTNVSSVKMSEKGIVKTKISLVFIILILCLWTYIYAFRDHVGTDFGTYYAVFSRIGYQTFEQFAEQQRDMLFGYVEYYSYHLFDGNWIAFSAICAILTYLPILLVYRQESSNFCVTALIYIFGLSYYSGFNGTRQAIAVSISFYAFYTFLKQGKYIRYVLAIMAAFGFHSTVIFAIPFHFIALGKVHSKITKICVGIMLASYVGLWRIWTYIIDFLEGIGQSKLASDYANLSSNGSSFIRLLVYAAPVIVGICFYNTVRDKYETVDSEIILMIFAVVFMLLSTRHWIFSRVSSYFTLSTPLFIPKLECIFTKNSKILGMLMIMLFYFAFMCVIMLRGDGSLLPYKFLTF